MARGDARRGRGGPARATRPAGFRAACTRAPRRRWRAAAEFGRPTYRFRRVSSEPVRDSGHRRSAGATGCARARLYLVCEARPGGRDPEELLRPALQAGVDVVQLREKDGDEREIVRAGRVFRRLCDAYDALFIVNDRPELAIACAADGVHLGQDDADPREVRRLVGQDCADRPVDAFADAGRRGARGRLHLRRAGARDSHEAGLRRRSGSSSCATRPSTRSVPFFAIGGIDAGNVGEVVAAGAERVAVVRAIRDAEIRARRRRPSATASRPRRPPARAARLPGGRRPSANASAAAAPHRSGRPRAPARRRCAGRGHPSPARTTSPREGSCRWRRASARWP